ncbi:erythromycin esterase family protein [Paenibacillus lutrae]|uniref:erythromycin esterase family protein n=1 Tax=Paenibacillus lutrae TaxID=2078573 RepID=UPI001913EB97|nr:erythromycin esterase family protein [Paenibacillus lutrae]
MSVIQRSAAKILAVTLAASCLFPALGHAAVVGAKEDPAPIVSSVEKFNKNWSKWIMQHAYSLTSIQPEKMVNGAIPSSKFQDLTFLKPLLLDKKLVYLGENTHGAAEYNLSKTRLIQYLHQELGYEVLAFESGMGDAAAAYASAKKITPEQLMKNSIFGVWWTQETLPLFAYIQESLSTDRPLILAGFDMQIQSPYSAFMKEWISGKDSKRAEAFVKADQELGEWGLGTDEKGYAKAKPELLKTYEEMKVFLTRNAESLQAAYPDNPYLLKIAERVMDNRIQVVNQYTEASIRSNISLEKQDLEPFLETMRQRDKMMADNLTWLSEKLYPDKKIIVWGHNVHIRKNNAKIMNSPYSGLKLMGDLMPERLKKQSYVIGLYMYQGKAANNVGDAYEVVKPEAGSLEHILHESGHAYTFVDMKYRKDRPGTSWMYLPRVSLDWGIMPESFIPRQQYDGLLLIDTVKPPAYIRISK